MTKRTVFFRASTLLALAVLPAAGCGQGPPLAPVGGKLVWQGKPLANVEVTFHPDPDQGNRGPSSRGVTDADGHYELRCEVDGRASAVPGAHRVVLVDLNAVGSAPPRGRGKRGPAPAGVKRGAASRLPAGFTDATETPLKAQVPAGGGEINLDPSARR
jgi:hypothetical protein